MHTTLAKKLIYRFKAGILKAKLLEKFKTITRLTERNIVKCYKNIAKKYF